MSGRIVRRVAMPVPPEWERDLNELSTNFNAELFRMFAKADGQNFYRLSLGFPVQAAAWLAWREDPQARWPSQVMIEIRDDLRWAFLPQAPNFQAN